MRKQRKTARGVSFDMERFVQSSEKKTIAIGNLGGNKNTNARGDILGKGGKVIKEREKVVRDYYRDELPSSMTKSIKVEPVKEEVFKNPAEALAEISTPKTKSKKTTTKKTEVSTDE
jgi:hypothetical protein